MLNKRKSITTAATEEDPIPLTRKLPSPNEYPIGALGKLLGGAALGIQDLTQAPVEICAMGVLSVATLAAQALADVELPTGEKKPLSGLFVTVAPSGERKTSVDNRALVPVKLREQELREIYGREYQSFLNAKEIYEVERSKVKKGSKGDTQAMRNKLEKLGPPPQAPLLPILTSPDPTVEGLIKLLHSGQPSQGIFSSEGGQFIGGHGLTDDNKLKTAATISTLWDEGSLKRVRATDDVLTLVGKRLTMHLQCQPDVATRLFADPILKDQGLLSRILLVAPESTMGKRRWRDPSPESQLRVDEYVARVGELLCKDLPIAEGNQNVLELRALTLSSEARQEWIEFYNNIEGQLGNGGALEEISGLANKLPEHAARLAAVMTLVEDSDARSISAETIASAIRFAEHHGTEALRLFGASRVNAELAQAEMLKQWLHDTWPEEAVSVPDIVQNGPNSIRDTKSANSLIGILEKHHWLIQIKGGAVIRDQKRKKAWQIRKTS